MHQTALGTSEAPLVMRGVIRTKNEEPRITSHRGRCGFLMFIESAGSFARRGMSRALGCISGLRSRARQRAKNKSSRLLRASGSCGSGRRRLRGIRPSRTAARHQRADGEASSPGSFAPWGSSTIATRLERRARRHRSSCQRSVTIAPLCGWFDTSYHSRASRLARGSFEGPHNTRLHLTAPREHFSHAAHGERV